MLDTRERLVRAAYEVFLQQGFNAVGIDTIIRKVGVTKTTFYNHFESKDDLVAAVLRWRNAQWPRQLRRVIEERAITDPAERILALLEYRDDIWELPKGAIGPFTRAACEYPSGEGPVRRAITEYRETVQREFLALAEGTGARDPEALKREIKLLMAGVAGLHLVGETDRPIETAIDLLRRTIAHHVKRTPARGSPGAKTRKKSGR
jgi:AcrR family transcriptional regulator